MSLVDAVGDEAKTSDQRPAKSVMGRVRHKRTAQPAPGRAVLTIRADDQPWPKRDSAIRPGYVEMWTTGISSERDRRGPVDSCAGLDRGMEQDVLHHNMLNADPMRIVREVVSPAIGRLRLAVDVSLPMGLLLGACLAQEEVEQAERTEVGDTPGMNRLTPDPVAEALGPLDEINIDARAGKDDC